MLFNRKHQVVTALITPFKDNHEVDFNALTRLIEYQITQGVDGLLILGTTAESATMSDAEKEAVVDHALNVIDNRVKVMLGVGSNCTKTTIKNHLKAKSLGVDASLIVTPYYNNPSSKHIINHYQAINDACDLPFLLYHVPTRTNSKLNIDDAKIILEMSNCLGIKDATGLDAWRSLIGSPNKLMYSGDDGTASEYCLSGGDGVISVLSNLSPSIMKSLLINNDHSYKKLCSDLGCETNPIPIKYLLKMYDLIGSDAVRLPLCTLDDADKNMLKKLFQGLPISI